MSNTINNKAAKETKLTVEVTAKAPDATTSEAITEIADEKLENVTGGTGEIPIVAEEFDDYASNIGVMQF